METKEIQIARVGLEGQGVGYDEEGNIYFVQKTLPGDQVKVSFDTLKKYRDTTLLEVLAKSPERVESSCEYFHECGGCDWLNWKYEEQLKAKEEILKHVLERGKLTAENIRPILPATNTLGYRNRIQLKARGKEVGFFRKATREIIDIEKCAVAMPQINEALKNIRETRTFKEPTKIELFINAKGEVQESINAIHAAEGFSQINDEQNKNLQEIVKNYVRKVAGSKVLELYAGDGNLSFTYLPFVKNVMAFDLSDPAILSAREKRDQLGEEGKKISFFKDRVDSKLKSRLPSEFAAEFDTLLLDPPRGGVGDFLGRFLHPKLKNIIYVSCSPVAFSQDVQALKEEFKLVEIQPVDMFPQTRHIEFVALFVRI